MRDKILNLINWSNHFFRLFFGTLYSCLKILFSSKFHTQNNKLKDFHRQIIVLGNGVSLNNIIERYLSFLSTQNIIVVNDFFLNEHFSILKPKIYVIADPAYWNDAGTEEMRETNRKMQQRLIEDVTWNMFFYVPVSIYNKKYFQEKFQKNKHIKVRAFNTATMISGKWMRYFFYNRLLAKPFSGNVMGSALFIAMQANVQKIYLFGVEHSWTKELYVDEQNRTCIHDKHFYGETEGKVWLKYNAEPYRIDEALFDIAKMLGGYREINEFAVYKKIKIYNCTKDSFIDAFQRKDADSALH